MDKKAEMTFLVECNAPLAAGRCTFSPNFWPLEVYNLVRFLDLQDLLHSNRLQRSVLQTNIQPKVLVALVFATLAAAAPKHHKQPEGSRTYYYYPSDSEYRDWNWPWTRYCHGPRYCQPESYWLKWHGLNITLPTCLWHRQLFGKLSAWEYSIIFSDPNFFFPQATAG